MNFLRKSYSLLRSDRIFNLNSCQFLCNLSTTSVGKASKGHFGNVLLLRTKSCQRPRFQPRPRSRCTSSSIPGLGQVDPQNCEQSRRNSSVTSSRLHDESREGNTNVIVQHFEKMKWIIESGRQVSKERIANIICDMMTQEQETSSDGQALLDLGLLLLQGCVPDLMFSEVPTGRVQCAQQVVSTLQQLGLSMSIEHYNELLTCYVENRHPTEPSEFLRAMAVEPNEETYQLLMWCVSDMDQALGLIQRMKTDGVPVSEPVFNALVFLHAWTGDSDSVQGVFETMRSAQLTPSSHTFTALLRGLAEYGDVTQMNETFQEAVTAGAALSEAQVLSVIKSLVVTEHEASIPSVLPWLPEQVSADGTSTLKNMLKQFVHLGVDDAVSLLISKLPVEESFPFGGFLYREMVKANRPVSSILSVCHLLSERNPLALSQATYAALRLPNTDMALALFEATKAAGAPVRAHYYWPLLFAARSKGEQELFRIVRHSREMGVLMNTNMLCLYVLRFVSLEAPTALLRKLQQLGYTLSEVFPAVLWALISSKRVDMAHQLCKAHPMKLDCEVLIKPLANALAFGHQLSSGVDLLKVFVKSCQQADDWVGRLLVQLFTNQTEPISPVVAENIIKGLSSAGLRCSSRAVGAVSRHLATEQQSEETRALLVSLTAMADDEQFPLSGDQIDPLFSHPQNMNLEELLCHLGELKAKKMNVRGVLRLLLLKYCQKGDLKGVSETIQELETGGFKLSNGMKSGLFEFYIKTNQEDKANTMYNQLSQDLDFNMDEYKVISFAKLLVTQGKTADAISVLETKSRQGIKETNLPKISKNCRDLLAATIVGGKPEDPRMMLTSLVKLGYCKVNNHLLGPLIKSFLLRDDTEGAVAEFLLCVKIYKFTPLRYDLMHHLISKALDKTPGGNISSDRAKELIDLVYESTRRTRNSVNVICDFIIALADVGSLEWLSRTVKESFEKIYYVRLTKRTDRLVDLDKPKAIQNLIDVFREYKALDLAPLFLNLLRIHCRHGDTQGALDLWSQMQMAACRPCKSFVATFRGLLRSHNVEEPVGLPDDGAPRLA